MMNCFTSYSVWKALETHFGSQSEAKTINLRYQLNTTKKNDLSMADYFVKMDNIADSLACAGIEDSDLIMHILGGIGSDFGDVATYLTAKASSMDLDNAYAMFLNKEARLEQERGAISANVNSNFEAHLAHNNYDQSCDVYYSQFKNMNRRGNFNGNKGNFAPYQGQNNYGQFAQRNQTWSPNQNWNGGYGGNWNQRGVTEGKGKAPISGNVKISRGIPVANMANNSTPICQI